MEEQILEIIKNYEAVGSDYIDPCYNVDIARDIRDHVMEFIGWLREQNAESLSRNGLYTNTDVYNYWLSNK
jgi:hypothetical protein